LDWLRLEALADPDGNGIWEAQLNRQHGMVYWVNKTQQKTRWDAPEGMPVPLPDHWEKKCETRTGRVYYVDHNTKRTSWDFPCDGKRTEAPIVECVVCLDAMHKTQCTTLWARNIRCCRHLFHHKCALQLIASGKNKCPICRASFTNIKAIPDVDANPEGWFRSVDFAGENHIGKDAVTEVLCALFPVDRKSLELEMPKLWKEWDVRGTSGISLADFKHADTGLLSFIRRRILHKETPSVKSAPAVEETAKLFEAPDIKGDVESLEQLLARAFPLFTPPLTAQTVGVV